MASDRDSVLVIAPEGDAHARAVTDRLASMGVDAVSLDMSRFPGALAISLGEDLTDITIDGRRVAPRAVYLRDLALDPSGRPGFDVAMRDDWGRTMAALRERSTFLMSILYRWEAAGVRLYNPVSAFQNITKPYQLALLAAAGLPVPLTRWTNDPDDVRRFAAERAVIYKPVSGGAATKVLDDGDLARLDRLRSAPVCFQELLPGTDLRVYVVDGRVVASVAIASDAIDFRQHELAIDRISIDDELAATCVRACATLGLRYTGMDLKVDAAGRPKILELNPSPMFLGFDSRAGTDILGALCAALATAS